MLHADRNCLARQFPTNHRQHRFSGIHRSLILSKRKREREREREEEEEEEEETIRKRFEGKSWAGEHINSKVV